MDPRQDHEVALRYLLEQDLARVLRVNAICI